MESDNRISVMLRGLDKDNGDVKFDDFIIQLDLIKKALNETQKIYSKKLFAYFKVVELRHKSPAFITLEAVPQNINDKDKTDNVIKKFFRSIDDISNNIHPEGFTYDTFKAYQNITSLKEKKRITEIVLARNEESTTYLENFTRKIENIMGNDEYEVGSYTGMLEMINIHSNQNVFYIYPTSNLPKLKCIFIKEQKQDVISSIDSYVTVIGKKKIKPNVTGSHSYEMKLIKIIKHPPEDDLPTLSQIGGIAPDITGDQNSDEFIRGNRNEW